MRRIGASAREVLWSVSHRLPDHAIGIEVREHNGAGLSPACGAASLAILTLVTTVFAFVLTVESACLLATWRYLDGIMGETVRGLQVEQGIERKDLEAIMIPSAGGRGPK